MNEKTESQDKETHAVGSDGSDKQLARRRLLKAGVSAAPIVLTLTSRPVLAWHCKPPSAYASANLSHRPQQTWTDEGTKTRSDWRNATSWPAPYIKTNIKNKWGQVVTPATTMVGAGLGSSTATMLSRLQSGTNLEQYLIAALLNIQVSANIGSNCLTTSEVQKMYLYGPTGNYSPPDSPGVKWGSANIIDYLQQNWIVLS